MKKLDFAKIVIWSCVILSALGIGSHFLLRRLVAGADADVKKGLLALRDVSKLSKNIGVLEQEKEADLWLKNLALNRINSFFDGQAKKAKMPRGPNVERPREETPSGAQGFQDTMYELHWQKSRNERIAFTREQVAALIWWLESESNLLKVTEVKVEADTKLLDDLWELRVWVTERRPAVAKSG